MLQGLGEALRLLERFLSVLTKPTKRLQSDISLLTILTSQFKVVGIAPPVVLQTTDRVLKSTAQCQEDLLVQSAAFGKPALTPVLVGPLPQTGNPIAAHTGGSG